MPITPLNAIENAQAQLIHHLATLFTAPDADGDSKAEIQDEEARANAAQNIAGSVQKLVGTIIDAMKDLDHRLRSIEGSGG